MTPRETMCVLVSPKAIHFPRKASATESHKRKDQQQPQKNYVPDFSFFVNTGGLNIHLIDGPSFGCFDMSIRGCTVIFVAIIN